MQVAMRRLLALALLSAFAAVAAGCGVGGKSSGAAGAPEPADLAWQAVQAAQQAGTAHYTFEADVASDGMGRLRLAIDGDVGRGQARADVSLGGNGYSLAGTLLFDGAGFFIKYLGRWYGEQVPAHEAQQLREDFRSEDRFLARFDDVFDGTVTAGPVTDGVSTWAFNGRLDAEGLAELAGEEGAPFDDGEREQLEKLADAARFTLLVGREDMLPRAFRFDLQGEGADLVGLGGGPGDAFSISLNGSFSRWGEPVQITAPSSYAPLDELFSQFLGL
jgi:hypothetical protein